MFLRGFITLREEIRMNNLRITVAELDTLLANYPQQLESIKSLPELQSKLDALGEPPEMGARASANDRKRAMLHGLMYKNRLREAPDAWLRSGS
jgi:hypothetical protein